MGGGGWREDHDHESEYISWVCKEEGCGQNPRSWVDHLEQWFPDTESGHGLCSPCNKEDEKQTPFLGCTESHAIKPMLKLI